VARQDSSADANHRARPVEQGPVPDTVSESRAPLPAQTESTPALENELRSARQKLAELRGRYTDQHPDVQGQLRVIESLERSAAAGETPELAKAKAELERLRVRYADAHPVVQAQLRKVAELEKRGLQKAD